MQTRIKISRQRQNKADTPAQCLVPHSVRKQEVQVELRWADKKKDPSPNHGPQQQRRQITCPTAFEKDEAQTSLFLPNVNIIGSGYRTNFKRVISEALFIKELKPDLNVQKDAYKLKLFN